MVEVVEGWMDIAYEVDRSCLWFFIGRVLRLVRGNAVGKKRGGGCFWMDGRMAEEEIWELGLGDGY